jgi:hypothetical protein
MGLLRGALEGARICCNGGFPGAFEPIPQQLMHNFID